MLFLGFIFAFFIGITLGLAGSGGSILTVPVLVYIYGVDPNLATTYSLFAIAVSSFVGSIRNLILKHVDLTKLFDFGFPSIVMVFVTRQFILPLIPKEFYIGPWVIHQNVVLMVLFGFVMLFSAWRMIMGEVKAEGVGERKVSRFMMVMQGTLLGLITGVVGAGGGFLIIPAFVSYYRMPMIYAVSTSLAIIALNSLFGLAGDIEKIPLFDWDILTPYTLLLIAGMFLGFYLSRFINNEELKKGLGYLILVIGIFVIIKEILSFWG